MKIVSVDIIDVKNPLQSAVAKWRPVVVRINTDEGVSGFGEVGMAYGVGASAGFGRTMSPVTGGIVAVAGMAGVSPFRVVKRNMVPLCCCCVVNFLVVYLFILP